MKRGYPRPRTMVGKTHSNRLASAGAGGSYGKKWENREYPHPYTANDGNIAHINKPRLRESTRNKICGTCGLHVKEDLVGLILYNPRAKRNRLAGNGDNLLHAEAGPYHLKCLTLNFTMCPMLAATKTFMPAVGLWDDVKDDIRKLAGSY
jgi:hypothetical protein